MSVVDIAVYHEGKRVVGPGTAAEALREARSIGGFVWAGYFRPDDKELAELAEVFGLHPLALEDVSLGHQRPKVERYDDVDFIVLRPARYLDDVELVEFGELHLFVGPDFIVSVRLAENPHLSSVRHAMEMQTDVLKLGPLAVMHAILDRVVDDYEPVAAGIENDIDEIEDELFDGAGTSRDVARRIYLLSREVNEFQRATRPLLDTLREQRLRHVSDSIDIEVQRSLRDVVDHLIPICDRADTYRQLLQNALSVHMSLVTKEREEQMAQMTQTTIDQSDAMKKISAWAAIIFAPTLISGIYGMNFAVMPELHWEIGYLIALGGMFAFAGVLYVVFKRKGWL